MPILLMKPCPLISHYVLNANANKQPTIKETVAILSRVHTISRARHFDRTHTRQTHNQEWQTQNIYLIWSIVTR